MVLSCKSNSENANPKTADVRHDRSGPEPSKYDIVTLSHSLSFSPSLLSLFTTNRSRRYALLFLSPSTGRAAGWRKAWSASRKPRRGPAKPAVRAGRRVRPRRRACLLCGPSCRRWNTRNSECASVARECASLCVCVCVC